MAFSQSDLDNIDAALVKVALGTRITSISIGGDTTTFSDGASVTELQQLRAAVAESLATSYSPRTYAKNGGRGY